MRDHEHDSFIEKQKESKPKIEDIVSVYLEGHSQRNAERFIAYLRGNKMAPRWMSTNSWKFCYKGKNVGFVRLKNGSWFISPFGRPETYDECIRRENLCELVWSSLKPCEHCLPCAPGKELTLGGKHFHNICGYFPIQFYDPDAAVQNDIIQLLDYRKGLIDAGAGNNF